MTATAPPKLYSGAPIATADGVVVMLHGRGATAEGILALGDELGVSGIAYVAPQAAERSWYPWSFLAPIAMNEPYLSQSLQTVDDVMTELGQAGVSAERVMLLGFSQGACLALEYAARHARRFGAIVGLSGGLIGADAEQRKDVGSLAGTPVFLGCSDIDAHIPLARVKHAAAVLANLGADVDQRIYPGMAHTIIDDEIRHVSRLLGTMAGQVG